jgi:hypothetical protein
VDVGIHADAVLEVRRVEAEHVRVDEGLPLVGARVFGEGEELLAGRDAAGDVEVDPADKEVVRKRRVEGIEAILLQRGRDENIELAGRGLRVGVVADFRKSLGGLLVGLDEFVLRDENLVPRGELELVIFA